MGELSRRLLADNDGDSSSSDSQSFFEDQEKIITLPTEGMHRY